VIWPLTDHSKSGFTLRQFIREALRRSKTSLSTLQVAIYYLIVTKPYLPKTDNVNEVADNDGKALFCGRRMFLTCLILASKYLQDRNYSATAWSKISGLKTDEISANERLFLQTVDWKLHVPEQVFDSFRDILIRCTSVSSLEPDEKEINDWIWELDNFALW
jgi:hypothetical protein